MKVFELAKELDYKALDLLKEIKNLDFEVKSHMASLDDEQIKKIKEFVAQKALGDKAAAPKKKKRTTKKKTVTSKKAKAVVIRRKKEVEEPEVPEVVAASKEKVEVVDTKVEATPEDVVGAEVKAEVEVEAVAEVFKAESVESVEPAAEKTEDVAPEPVVEASAEEVTVKAEETPVEEPKKKKKSLFSLLRIAKKDDSEPKSGLVVEEEAPDSSKSTVSMEGSEFTDPETKRMKTYAFDDEVKISEDPHLKSHMGTSFKSIEDFWKNKQNPGAPKPKRDTGMGFRSKDYMRRERVYKAPKKKMGLTKPYKKTQITQAATSKRMVEYDRDINVKELAGELKVKARELARKLRDMGVERPEGVYDPRDWIIDLDTVLLVAEEYGYNVDDVTFHEEEVMKQVSGVTKVDDKDMVSRGPVITVMGHIDHGKTSLLDFMRASRVTSGEAGGITQHIGAYSIDAKDALANLAGNSEDAKKDKKHSTAKKTKQTKAKKGKAAKDSAPISTQLTFIDTPGHAAFTEMRARGSKVTDIVILVVAANDGVMPQTREAIDHAKAAEVPLIVAVNKMDLPDANPDKVTQQLSEMGLVSEEWGGDTIFCKISAKTGEGIDKLIEMIQLQSEILELKARGVGAAEGTVIEAKLDKGAGTLATVLIQKGELKIGDHIVAGIHTGKVRRMTDDRGKQITVAGPSTPVEILGLGGVPEAGQQINAVADEKAAKDLLAYREKVAAEAKDSEGVISAEEMFSRMADESLQTIPIILKADVKGTAEAIQAALLKIPQEKIKLKIITNSVGAISESDILLASASNAHVYGFNVRPDAKAAKAAEVKQVQMHTYTIIYELIDSVTQLLTGFLVPETKEIPVGSAEVRNVFNISKAGTVAGSFVTQGKIQRNNLARLVRDGRVIYTGKVSGLKRFKDDAKEVAEGYECGISLENYNDIKEKDVIETYTTEEIQVTLEGSAN